MGKHFLAILLALGFLMLIGGNSMIEVDDQVYVPTMGIDWIEGGLRLSVQIPSDGQGEEGGSQSSQGPGISQGGGSQGGEGEPSGGGGVKGGYLTVTARERSFTMCLDVLRAGLPRRPNYMQIKLIVFSEEVARQDGFFDLLSEMVNTRQLSPNATVIVTQCPAYDFVSNLVPQVGMSLTRSIEGTYKSLESTSYVERMQFISLYQDMMTHSNDPSMMLAGIQKEKELSEILQQARQPGDISPSDWPVQNQHLLIGLGAAILNREKMVDTLTGYEVQLKQILDGTATDALLELAPEGLPKISVFVRQIKPPQNRMDVVLGSLDISLTMSAYTQLDRALTAEEHEGYAAYIESMLTEHILQLLDKVQGNKVDLMGYAGIAARKFAMIEEWEAYRWQERWPEMDVRVEVAVQMRDPRDGPGSQPNVGH